MANYERKGIFSNYVQLYSKEDILGIQILHFQIQGLVKGERFCFRNLDFYFRHGESTSPASKKSKDLNKVLLLLQDLDQEIENLNKVIVV